MKQHEKEAEVTRVVPENKNLAEALLKLEKKITETEKKAGTFTSKKFSHVSADVFPVQNKPTFALYGVFILANTHVYLSSTEYGGIHEDTDVGGFEIKE